MNNRGYITDSSSSINPFWIVEPRIKSLKVFLNHGAPLSLRLKLISNRYIIVQYLE